MHVEQKTPATNDDGYKPAAFEIDSRAYQRVSDRASERGKHISQGAIIVLNKYNTICHIRVCHSAYPAQAACSAQSDLSNQHRAREAIV